MALTSSQRKILRRHAQTMIDDLQLGKAGITREFEAQARGIFQRRELVKVRLAMEIQGQVRQELGRQLAQVVEAELVAVLGKTLLLYKPNPQLDIGKRFFTDGTFGADARRA